MCISVANYQACDTHLRHLARLRRGPCWSRCHGHSGTDNTPYPHRCGAQLVIRYVRRCSVWCGCARRWTTRFTSYLALLAHTQTPTRHRWPQYRHGMSTREAWKLLYKEGGIPRFYRGLTPALMQGQLCLFGAKCMHPHVIRACSW